MDAVQLLIDAIAGEHGDIVAEQFTNSYENNDFEDQNENALKLILTYLEKVKSAKVLENSVSIEIYDYISDLKDFLN